MLAEEEVLNPSSEAPRPLRLLLIEDSDDDAAILLRALRRGGYDPDCLRVDNPSDLARALDQGGWEAVVTDYSLPTMNGRTVLRLLRERRYDGPVIAVSGSLAEESLVEAMRAGAHDFISKDHLARLIPALQRELAEAADRSARQQAESALGQTEERLRSVLQNMPVMLVAFGADGQILVWNRECERVTGAVAADIVGRPDAFARLFPDAADREPLLREWRRLGGAYRDWEMPICARDGSPRTISWSSVSGAFPVPGWASWVVGIDVSHRRRMESDLREANRMKDDFLATLSHELRTPLTAILGWVHLLRARQLDPAMAERAVAVIERNAKAQAQLIADILDVSRIVTGKFRLEPRASELGPILGAAIDSVRPAADAKRIRVAVDADPDVGPFLADPDRLQQVVWNLLSNATKFTPEGGSVVVRVRAVDSRVEIAVTDTGIGIEPNLLPHVFERFRQGDSSSTRSQGGLGLGLAIVRHIVELHGGTVSATSEGVGRGTTFTVAFPLRAAERASGGPAAEVAEPVLDGVRVLVVDDDPDILDLVATVLRQRGAQVAVADGVDAALQALASERPDILLSDLAMPGHDGFDLIRRVRLLPGGESIRAAALTGYARTEDRLRALWAGFETHIPKPVQPTELAAVVASLAGRTGRRLLERAQTGKV